jgi:hypothetical protein
MKGKYTLGVEKEEESKSEIISSYRPKRKSKRPSL